MPLFPPGTPVTVLVDGRPLASYVHAYVAGGRVYAPVDPLLLELADAVWYEGDTLVIERGARRVRVRLTGARSRQPDGTYVMVGPVLRALGAAVRFDPRGHRLIVRTPTGAVASPTPFDPAAPSVAPSGVFTQAPPPTPRPIWTGSPLPRRTPLPLPPPSERAPSRSARSQRSATAARSRSLSPRSATLRNRPSIASMTGKRS